MNHYQVLGVAPDASPAAIRRAYLDLARRHHPDRVADPEGRAVAEEQMRQVNAAWAVLSDEARRAGYDRELSGAADPWSASDEVDLDDDLPLLDEVGTPPSSAARLVTSGAPVLLVASLIAIVIGNVVGLTVLTALGLMGGALALVSFIAAPLLVMSSARRNER